VKKIGIPLKRRLLPLEGNHLFHSELAAVAGQKEKRRWLGQLVKKIGIPLKRRFLPLEGNHLFHSELAAVAGQKEKRRRLEQHPGKAPFVFWGCLAYASSHWS
jgi:hypothetical protein